MKEPSIRELVKQLERNETQYKGAKDDYELSDAFRSFLDGRIRESEIIRIELERILVDWALCGT